MTPNAEAKKRAILDRIKRIQEDIAKGQEYLETGEHAAWHGFRPWFVTKVKDGKVVPPHKDWVNNVFLPRRERALRRSEDALEKVIAREKRD